MKEEKKEERADITLREDNILEINRVNGQSFTINLKEVYMVMIEKSDEYMDILLNGIRNIHIPSDFYEGIVEAFKLSKMFEIHKQNYYTISRKLKQVPEDPKQITNDMYQDEKQHLDDLFVNIKSYRVLVILEEPKYTEDDTEKIGVDVVDKGMVIFYKEVK